MKKTRILEKVTIEDCSMNLQSLLKPMIQKNQEILKKQKVQKIQKVLKA